MVWCGAMRSSHFVNYCLPLYKCTRRTLRVEASTSQRYRSLLGRGVVDDCRQTFISVHSCTPSLVKLTSQGTWWASVRLLEPETLTRASTMQSKMLWLHWLRTTHAKKKQFLSSILSPQVFREKNSQTRNQHKVGKELEVTLSMITGTSSSRQTENAVFLKWASRPSFFERGCSSTAAFSLFEGRHCIEE